MCKETQNKQTSGCDRVVGAEATQETLWMTSETLSNSNMEVRFSSAIFLDSGKDLTDASKKGGKTRPLPLDCFF